MADFFAGLVTGGFAGAAVKWLVDIAVKRQQERISGRRKMLIGDIDALAKLVDPLTKASLAYYSKPSSDGADLARQIRVDLKGFARHWDSLNNRMRTANQPILPNEVLVRFRQSLTLGLDDASRIEGLGTP